ncbi:DUF4145 domain-containing protein [Marinimicrobium sp. LS-A18]|uniref:DUF4145 domain-containing protein n=1 Tax=Marinimicrobium sp. LS-A18 TaxID=1381596 RepID=UPI000465EF43|nr:DUF4145 domain-containing protein [Marinimicrobium sp. LS-A18]
MNTEKFSSTRGFIDLKEIDRVELLGFYHSKVSEVNYFTIADVCGWLDSLSLAKPNKSRLKRKLLASKNFVKGPVKYSYKLHENLQKSLEKEFPQFQEDDKVIETINPKISKSLYSVTRGYIEPLCRQINASYENNIFDGTAVLMRRLLEIMLILSYEKLGIGSDLKDPDNEYKNLNTIVGNALTNSTLSLSRNTRDYLDQFRKIGNFSAHKIHYNTKKSDIRNIVLDYRAAIEELLYKSGLIQ